MPLYALHACLNFAGKAPFQLVSLRGRGAAPGLTQLRGRGLAAVAQKNGQR
jgi:hypothetical protein